MTHTAGPPIHIGETPPLIPQDVLLGAQMETMLDGVLVVALDQKILFHNTRFREIWGIRDDIAQGAADGELLGLVRHQLVDAEQFLARTDHLYRHPTEIGRDEIRLVDGRVLDRYTAPIAGADGCCVGRIWYFRDVTPQANAMAAAADWKCRYDEAAEAAGHVLYDLDLSTDKITWSSNCVSVLGYTCDELAGGYSRWLGLLHPEDRGAFAKEIERVTQSRGPFRLEYRIVRRDGTWILVQDHGRVIGASDGAPQRMVGFLIDVTEQRHAELHRRKQSEILQTIFDHIPVMIAFIDKGELKVLNRAFERTFGWTVETLRDRDVVSELYPDPHEQARVRAFIAHAEGKWGEFRALARNGAQFDTAWADIRLSDGSCICIGQNMTERKIAEQLERERSGLREAVAAMERVLGVVGHELRTPLAALRAISEFLMTDGARETAEWHGFLIDLSAEVDRMAETVNNILEAARLNSGRARWNWGSVDLAETCQQAVATFEPLLDTKRIKLSTRLDEMACRMTGDADAIRRLLVNLLSNAHKHTADGSIEIHCGTSADAQGAWVNLTISDTGSGIGPEILSRLGEAFALNSGVVGGSYVGGTGLGMAICKGIVQAHGGAIRVDSESGRGTTVTVRLRADLPAAATGETITLPVTEVCS
jgi:PAS domain S-box-containing protein